MKRVEDLLGGALLKRKLRQIGIWIVESFVAFVIDCSVHGCDMWGGEKPVAIVIHCSCEAKSKQQTTELCLNRPLTKPDASKRRD